MKRFLLFALAVIVYAACSKDAINEQQNMQTIVDEAPETLVVGFEGDVTRIQLNEAQKTVWTKGDLVSVFYKSDANQKYEYRGETGERTAELHKVSAGSSTTKMGYVVVAYPYSEEYIISPATGNLETMLPAVQHYAVDSYGVGDNLMVSCSEFTQFSLKSVCGWLKLQLTGNGEKVKSITLRGNNGEQVAGLIHVDTKSAEATLYSEEIAPDDNGNANGSLVIDDAMVTELTLDCGEGVTLGKEATAFYIALPPQTFENGLTIEIEDTNALKMTKSTDKTIVIERNTIQPMAMFGYEGDFEKSEYCLTAEFEIDENYLNTYVYWFYPTEETNSLVNIDYGDGTFGKNSMHTYPSGGNYVVKYYFERPITEITHSAFTSSAIKSIIIPNEVVKIGYMAFNNSKLASISFEKDSKLTTIEQGAFTFCRNLKSISLPNTVTEIGDCVFAGCEKLEEILSHGAKYVNNLFGLLCEHNTSPYKVVACPSGRVEERFVVGGLYTKLSWGAFSYGNIKYIDIWIQEIDQYNFIYDDVLEGVNLTRTTTIANDVLSYCSKLKELSLPIVTSIGSYSFCHNDSLETIEFGSDSLSELTTIANDNVCLHTVYLASGIMSIVDSFNSCAAITEVYCKAVTPPALTNSFDSMVAPTIYVPAESVNSYKSADGWKEFASYIVGYDFETGEIVPGQPNTEIWYTATETVEPYNTSAFGANIISNEWDAETGKGVITFDGEVTMIGEDAFYGCSSLTSVNIPYSVTLIGGYAFNDCSNLTTIYIPYGVTDIFMYAFNGCSSLTSVNIPNGVTAIDDSAFEDCSSLTSITIPESITSIGHSAFKYCSNLTSVNIPNGVTSIGGYAFSGCSSLTSITIPNSVTSIEDGMFNACSSLRSITLSENVTTIRSCAFDGCISLESVVIPDSVTSIGSYAFLDCSSLERVTIGNHVTSIGGSAFHGCSNLNGVYIRDLSAWCKISFSYWTYSNPLSNGVKLYLNNIEVTELTIPSDITEIKDNAFEGCISLTSLTISDSITSIGEWTFSGCSNLKSIYCKATTPPTGYSSMFPSDANDLVIYVPRDYVYDYQTADGWSSYADSIVGYDF